jgi:lipid II:glycine glycyltransferase (peptidoglycan interpeptide bridge formation enzyme)
MEIIHIIEGELQSFLKKQKQSQFLQSWEWGEFNEKSGCKVIRLGVKKSDGLIAVATLTKKPLLMGKSYFFCPRGPVTNDQFSISNTQLNSKLQIQNYNHIYKLLFGEIENLAKEEDCIFLRFEPLDKFQIFDFLFSILKTIDIQPSKTLILDISKSEDEFLSQMHQKTRYNIRLAEKRGVVVREATEGDFEEFWKIMEETRIRDGFRLHPKEHYEKILELDIMTLLVAEYESKMIAGIILSIYGDMGTYVHGASSNEYRNSMAPHLLQWNAIKMSKEKNCKYYDFNGIDENKWPGVTRFKKGFGGEEVEYPGTYDFVFDPAFYNLYKFARKVRRAI